MTQPLIQPIELGATVSFGMIHLAMNALRMTNFSISVSRNDEVEALKKAIRQGRTRWDRCNVPQRGDSYRCERVDTISYDERPSSETVHCDVSKTSLPILLFRLANMGRGPKGHNGAQRLCRQMMQNLGIDENGVFRPAHQDIAE